MDQIKMLGLLALRTLVSHRVKNAIVGLIMAFGTMLVVLGTSLLDSIETSMEESITASATGHIQVYAADADDDLAIFGQMGNAAMDIGELDAYRPYEQKLKGIPHVKAVVPMALGNAVSFGKSELDRVLFSLRQSVKNNDTKTLAQDKAHAKQIAKLMLEENRKMTEISTNQADLEADRQIIEQVLSDAFWTEFDQDPGPKLEFLDTKLAPLSTEGRLIYARYIATEPQVFAESFDRFQIADGEMIPEGQRGFLFSKRFYDQWVKNRVARDFDKVKEEWDNGKRIATDSVLKNQVERMSRVSSAAVYQLDADETPVLTKKLKELMPGADGSIEELFEQMLLVDDSNIEARYTFFYDEVGPMIDMYDIKVGDDLVLQAFTKSGYVKSVKVKVWGTFNFKGLETSDMAGATNIMDLITFRQLYGKMSDEQREELSEIREEAGVDEVSAEDAEAALFGGDAEIEEVVETPEPTENADGETAPTGQGESFAVDIDRGGKRQLADSYSMDDVRDGLVLNMALILDDPRSVTDVIDVITALNEREDLNIKAVNWQAASGIVGQFIFVIRLVLYVAIFIIFLVALVIINNSMVMATMERIPEIGTMRAIGAQKSTIMILTLMETLVLCIVAGVIGALIGAGLVSWMGAVGIPAGNDVMVFLFGGPRLHPAWGISNLVIGAVIISVVSIISTLYPAIIATRVQPVVAMRGKD